MKTYKLLLFFALIIILIFHSSSSIQADTTLEQKKEAVDMYDKIHRLSSEGFEAQFYEFAESILTKRGESSSIDDYKILEKRVYVMHNNESKAISLFFNKVNGKVWYIRMYYDKNGKLILILCEFLGYKRS